MPTRQEERLRSRKKASRKSSSSSASSSPRHSTPSWSTGTVASRQQLSHLKFVFFIGFVLSALVVMYISKGGSSSSSSSVLDNQMMLPQRGGMLRGGGGTMNRATKLAATSDTTSFEMKQQPATTTTTAVAGKNANVPEEAEDTSSSTTTMTKATVSNKKEPPSSPSYDICVVGAGLSGAVIAERYATQLDKTVLVMEKRDHIGGNCYDYIDEETGIRVSKYGAHLFHTKYERVWDYVQKFSKWTKYEHKVVAFVEGKHVPVPVNIDTVNALFDLGIQDSTQMDQWLAAEQVQYDRDPQNSEEMAMSRVGRRLYELIFKPYTIKQWAKTPAELGPEVTARIPVRNNHDGRYFGDPYQALPSNGYTAIFEKMLDHKNIEVQLETDYFEQRDSLNCGRIYFTGPIDAYFAHLGWDKLEYRSLDFERKVVKNVDYFQPMSVVNHPSADVNFTRIVEYKHMLNQTSPHTLIFYEHSKDGGEPYYPVPNPKNQELFQQYKDMAQKETNVSFAGRLANYKYFNMDQSILNALELFDMDTGKQQPAVSVA